MDENKNAEMEGYTMVPMIGCMSTRDNKIGTLEKSAEYSLKGSKHLRDIKDSTVFLGGTGKFRANKDKQYYGFHSYYLILEGEIYNSNHMSESLENAGYELSGTNSEAEIFLKSYLEWGLEAFRKIKGKWSAAIYDESDEKLLCFRDHFGTKPLYYYHSGEEFYFSSLISPLLSLKENPPAENTLRKIDYLKYGLTDHTEETFFEEIKQLRPGQYLVFEDGEVRKDQIPSSETQEVDVRESVKNTVNSKTPDDEFAVTLSGGLDSSIVASLTSEEDPKTYTADIENDMFEESENKDSVVQKFGLDNKEVEISVERILENTRGYIKIQEEPIDIFAGQAQKELFEEVSEDGYEYVLTGTGADEIFFGYNAFIPEAIAESFKNYDIIKGTKLLTSYYDKMNLPMISYLLSLVKPWNTGINKLTESGEYLNTSNYKETELKEDPESLEISRERQLNYFWFPSIMRMVDKNAKASGIQVRNGLTSSEILDSAKQHKNLQNFGDGLTKKVLRDAFQEELPKRILEDRKKIGFLPPKNDLFTPKVEERFLEVFRSDTFQSREHVRDEKLLKALKNRTLNFRIAYRFYSYEMWAREFLDLGPSYSSF